MKRIFYSLVIVGAIFLGCNPMEDINNDIDAQSNPIVGEDEITLTSDDYADLVDQGDEEPDFYETFEAFESMEDAGMVLPPFLSDKYPLWGEGSSVLVHFNLYNGNPEDVNALVNADGYTLNSDDYPTAGGSAFLPSETADDYIPGILSTQMPDAEEGDIAMVEYKDFTEEPVVGLAPVVEYNFAASFEGWTPEEVSGADEVWTSQSTNVQGNGYFGGAVANEEWLVSPSIDLSGESNLKFQITQEIDFLSVPEQIDIMISTDYAGDVTMATWTTFDFDKTAYGDMTASEDFDFSDYDGETITIAFKYVSSDTDAGRWRIGAASIKTEGIEGPTITRADYYKFDGSSWEKMDDVYYLTSNDYDSMGEGSGQPGQYNNFSGSVPAENYIPAFLEMNYPYAQEEDQMFIVYKYYNGASTITKGNLYTFENGEWSMNMSSLQFGFEDGVWVPDNTIRYTLVGSDYTYVAENYADVEGYVAAAGNLATYGNFNRGNGPTGWSDEMVFTVLTDLLSNVIDPTAEEGQKYELSYNVYIGTNAVETLKLITEGGEWIEQAE